MTGTRGRACTGKKTHERRQDAGAHGYAVIGAAEAVCAALDNVACAIRAGHGL